MTLIDNRHILLMQSRNDPRVRQEEHESFARHSGLAPSQIDILNVFDTPRFSADEVKGYDALFVGGASEASVLEPDKCQFLDSGKRMLRYCADRDVPVFASCFGFQLAVMAFHGEVVHDGKDFEQGSLPITLTMEAETDPLFHDTPNPFLAVSIHKQKALRAPIGFETLAYTDVCCHAFRIPNKPFWAFQFHPEVDRDTLIERLTIYQSQYTKDPGHLQSILNTVQDTPESNSLLRKFVDRVLR